MLTTAEHRAVQQLTTSGGNMAVVALDQRQSLLKTRARAGLPTDAETLLGIKRDIASALGPAASGILLDPEIALPALIDENVVQRDTGVLVAVEHSGALEQNGLRVSELLPNLGAAGVRRLGGTAAKLLVYVRPDRENVDGQNGRFISDVVAECAAVDLLLIVEVLTYRLADEEPADYERAKPTLIREAARLAEACGAKMLKLESPGSVDACAWLTNALGVPWAVLSAGVDHETFLGTLRDAMAGGASGFIAGRSLWKEAALLSPDARREFLLGEGCRRLDELLSLIS